MPESEAWLDDNWQKGMQVPHEIFRLERFDWLELATLLTSLAFSVQYGDRPTNDALRVEILQEMRRRNSS